MAREVASRRRFDRHFSFGALIGSVFAGLWAALTMQILPNAESISDLPSHAVATVLASMFIAIFWTVPMSVVVGPIVFVVAILGRAHSMPGFVGGMGLGAAVGMTIGSLVVLHDVVVRGAVVLGSLWFVLAGLAGGVAGGAAYRALFVYRHPSEGHDRQGGLV